MKKSLLQKLNAAKRAKQPVAHVTDMVTGQQALVHVRHDGTLATEGEIGLSDELLAQVAELVRADKAAEISAGETTCVVNPHNPPLRLAIVGAVHIAQALTPIATLAGYEVTIIDPREAFATTARFPDVRVTTDWPEDAMAAFAPDSRSAIVALTHDPKIDDPALDVALKSPAFYIGALGSGKTQKARRERLSSAGYDAAALARIHGPIGLDIGARTPAEIALSIMAEMTLSLRGPKHGKA
jgi:xanthine dehydrogenase accessory factor